MSEALAIVIATAFGPIAAVSITLWHQARESKRGAKERLFITLMAHRKSNPIAIEWVRGLNLVDVVYADSPKVVEAWHDLYDYLHVRPMDQRQFDHKHLHLLSQMALTLGYKSLQQIDIDRFYSPEAHGAQVALNNQIQGEMLRFLQAISALAAQAQPQQPQAGVPPQGRPA